MQKKKTVKGVKCRHHELLVPNHFKTVLMRILGALHNTQCHGDIKVCLILVRAYVSFMPCLLVHFFVLGSSTLKIYFLCLN